ncbi:hypothetical protein BgiMline_019905 [Biomphalaria glabrata]|nr:hypothetical protein BgiMline_029639 [Biomphalaria glabrata]
MRSDARHRLHIPADDVSEEDIEKDFNYVKSDDDGLARGSSPRDDWSASNSERLVPSTSLEEDGDEDVQETGKDIKDDIKFDTVNEGAENKGSSLDGNAKKIFLEEDPKESGKQEDVEDNEDERGNVADDDFEQLKAISSRLQNNEEENSHASKKLNLTGNERFHQLVNDYKMEKLKKNEDRLASLDDENNDPLETGKTRSSGRSGSIVSVKGNLSHRTTARGKRPKLNKGSTTKSFKQSTLSMSRPNELNKLHKHWTTSAIEVKKNSSEYGIDDDSISEMIGQSGSSHVNKTAFLIEDKGVDKIDVPISGSTNWTTLIHGRREVIIAGSVIAIVGILVLVFSIIHLLVLRKKRKSSNVNNNRYHRLGTEEESVAMMKPHQPAVFMSSEESTDDEENDEEDTLYIRGGRKT